MDFFCLIWREVTKKLKAGQFPAAPYSVSSCFYWQKRLWNYFFRSVNTYFPSSAIRLAWKRKR